MVNWWIGCSGFHYNHWKGEFYPDKLAKTKWFDYYNNRFKTLELNVTFYRFPRLPALQTWYDQSPAGFRFSVKAPKFITHYRQFVNAKQMVNDFYSIVQEGLRDKVGCILFQMPERTTFKESKLEQILDTVDPAFTNVMEFRNASWWRQDVYDALSEKNIAFCGMSHPKLPEDVVQNTPVVYYRFHGIPDLYRSKYDTTELERVCDVIRDNKKAEEVFIYFNNDIDASAITNAFQMQGYINEVTKGNL